MYTIIIIIVYMYLIGNGMLIRRVYVWYRDLRPVHTESTLYLDIPLSRYYLELSRLNCVHTALCARSARCAIAHMPRPFCAIIRIKRETRVGMDRWLALVIVVLFTFVLSMRRKRLALERQQRRKVFEDDLRRRRQRLKA